MPVYQTFQKQTKCIWTNHLSIGQAGHGHTYYQWYTSRTFSRINSVIKASGIRMMYDIYHEMDIMHFVERINEIWDDYYTETKRY